MCMRHSIMSMLTTCPKTESPKDAKGSENWSAADRLRNLTRIIPEGLIILAKNLIVQIWGENTFLYRECEKPQGWKNILCLGFCPFVFVVFLGWGQSLDLSTAVHFFLLWGCTSLSSLSRLTWRVSLTLDTLHVIATSVHDCSLRTLSEALENYCSLSNADIGFICSGDIFKSYDLLVNFL